MFLWVCRTKMVQPTLFLAWCDWYLHRTVLHWECEPVCECVCVSDWFLFYGLTSRVLVILRNKSTLFDLNVNANKTHVTAGRTHMHINTHTGHSWPLDNIYKDTERETFSFPLFSLCSLNLWKCELISRQRGIIHSNMPQNWTKLIRLIRTNGMTNDDQALLTRTALLGSNQYQHSAPTHTHTCSTHRQTEVDSFPLPLVSCWKLHLGP